MRTVVPRSRFGSPLTRAALFAGFVAPACAKGRDKPEADKAPIAAPVAKDAAPAAIDAMPLAAKDAAPLPIDAAPDAAAKKKKQKQKKNETVEGPVPILKENLAKPYGAPPSRVRLG